MNGKMLNSMRTARAAKMFCNAGLFLGILLVLLSLMPLLRIFFYLIAGMFALVVVLVWLLSLLLFMPFDLNFIQTVFAGGDEIMLMIQQIIVRCAPYLCAVALVLSAMSIPLIIKSKVANPKGRIVAASVAIGLAIIGTVVIFLGARL